MTCLVNPFYQLFSDFDSIWGAFRSSCLVFPKHDLNSFFRSLSIRHFDRHSDNNLIWQILESLIPRADTKLTRTYVCLTRYFHLGEFFHVDFYLLVFSYGCFIHLNSYMVLLTIYYLNSVFYHFAIIYFCILYSHLIMVILIMQFNHFILIYLLVHGYFCMVFPDGYFNHYFTLKSFNSLYLAWLQKQGYLSNVT